MRRFFILACAGAALFLCIRRPAVAPHLSSVDGRPTLSSEFNPSPRLVLRHTDLSVCAMPLVSSRPRTPLSPPVSRPGERPALSSPGAATSTPPSSRAGDLTPPSSKSKLASQRSEFKKIRAAGTARLRAQAAAEEAENAVQSKASSLWVSAFDFVFDSASDAEVCGDFLIGGRTVLLLVPGFSSWSALRPDHIERWRSAELLSAPSGGTPAVSMVFKWPCGNVHWAAADAQIEAHAAWSDAHEQTVRAAQSLTRLVKHLSDLGSRVVIAAHSLGARVALNALCKDLAAPKVAGLLLLGGAVDCGALGGGDPSTNPCPEFPFSRLMSKCAHLTLAHSDRDPTLNRFWPGAEQARCGRSAPSALGCAGPLPANTEEQLGDWADRIEILDLSGALQDHDPMTYLLHESVTSATRRACFDGEAFLEGRSFKATKA